jgi:hypothetical protein
MKKILLLTILVSCLVTTNAQTQFSGWLATFNTVKVGKKTSIHSDFQWRSGDEIKFTQTLLLRAGLNYHLTKKSTLTAGYAFIHNYRNMGGVDGYVPEHRIWEQFIYAHKIGKVNTSHRFRLEQRFISRTFVSNDALQKDGTVYASRFRYFIRNILPFNNSTTFKKGPFAALQNEVFLNIGNKANVNGKTFDQNRLYGAIGYRFSKKFDLEAGYMNQYINGRTNDVNNHIVQVASYIRL